MARKTASDFDPELLELFDRYVHGGLSRRELLDQAARYAVGGMTAAMILDSLGPNYLLAQQVARDDRRLTTGYVSYSSPHGSGTIRAYYVRPANAPGRLPGVVVVHENRGLNPYIEDVARRLGVAGFLALAPDALTPLGGYPGDDDRGREMQSRLDPGRMIEDFAASVVDLRSRQECTGKVGVVGFCYGGGVANQMAVRFPDLGAAVPFYGRQPSAEETAKIKAPLLIHYAGLDERVNAGWPAWEAALKANHVEYTAYIYEGVNHGFHNDTTPRYDEAAAKLAWQRTIQFFEKTLK